jgi:hypothetical protein
MLLDVGISVLVENDSILNHEIQTADQQRKIVLGGK